MKYKIAGKTNKKISSLSMGCMRFKDDQEEVDKIIEECVTSGINYYECSPGYVDGKCENLVGNSIKNFRNKVFLSTKTNYKQDRTEDSVKRRIEASLKALKTDKIDFYHMWFVNDINDMSGIINGPLKAAEKFKQQGVISHIGITTHMRDEDIVQALKMYPFETITISYNLLNAHMRPKTIDFAKQNKIALFSMNPLGGGLLSINSDLFDKIKKDKPYSQVEAALLYVLSNENFSTAISGMEAVDMVKENVKAVDLLDKFDKSISETILKNFKSIGPEFCVGCDYCLPCPENVMIPRYLKMLNQYILGGIKEVLPTYNKHVEAGRIKKDNIPANCVNCGVCLSKCPSKLNIPLKLKDAAKMLKKIRSVN